jgi:riboflavin kinase / FMN adenylyltransferase
MQVHTSLQNLPSFTNAVVTIGTFDGVHIGHQHIIKQLQATAKNAGGETVIITFHPHPRSIVQQNAHNVLLLNTLDEKISLLTKAGIHHLVVVPFTEAFANQTAEAYCTDFLYAYFKPHTVIIGYDHKFGKNRSGDYRLLEKMGTQLGFAVTEISQQVVESIAISSTQIRKALQTNQIHLANQLLGYPYFFSGTVVKGNQLGRTIGFATANLQIATAEKLIPANGVYAVQVQLQNHSQALYKGMMNIGNKPTVNGTNTTIEVHILDFDTVIYDEVLQVTVHHFIRAEQKFNSLADLQNQLAKDKATTMDIMC